MRRKIVAGNWKMNTTRDEAFSLATEIRDMVSDESQKNTQIILCPPFVHLAAVAHIINGSGIHVGAQNCWSENNGAYTGEVSASMIASVGADYVLVGHSERRAIFGESDELLMKKVSMALASELKIIFCIGETLEERDSGTHEKVIEKQLGETVFMLVPELFSSVVIAYEPVWAIGTRKTASPQQVQEMHHFIRQKIALRFGDEAGENTAILYGGSVNDQNAKELFSLPDVDGGLIGGASLKSRNFVNIIKSI